MKTLSFSHFLTLGLIVVCLLGALSVLAQEPPDNSDVVNYPPSAPGIAGPDSVASYQESPTFTIGPSTDYENSPISYGIDWEGNYNYQWYSAVPSGSTITANHTFSQTTTFGAVARDYQGQQSERSSHTVTVPATGTRTPVACNVGPRTVLGGQDGFVDQGGGVACDARNYIAREYGGTGELGDYARCADGQTGNSISPVGACVQSVFENGGGTGSSFCEVRGYECEDGGAVGGDSCTPVGYDVTTLLQYNTKKQQCIDDGYTYQQFETEHEQGDVPFAGGNGCLVSWDKSPGFNQAFYVNPSCGTGAGEVAGSCGGSGNEFWGGGMNCSDSSPTFVSCAEGQREYFRTTETQRTCPGLPPERGYIGTIGRCVPDASCTATPAPSCTAESRGAQWYSGGQQTFIAGEGLSSPLDCAREVAFQGGEYWNREVVYDAASEDPYFTNCYMVTNPTGLTTKLNYIAGPPSSRPIEHNFDSGRSCAAPTICTAEGVETTTAGECNALGYDQLISKYQGNNGYFLWTEANTQGTNKGECIQTKPAQQDFEVLSAWRASSCPAPADAAPAAPTINGQGNGGNTNGVLNQAVNFDFLATDPETNTIKYGIDWDNNGDDPDQWLPRDGSLVPSGTVQSEPRTYLTEGTYTIRAIAVDSNGNRSAWTSHTVTIGAAAGICLWKYVDGSDLTDLTGNVVASCRLPSIADLPQCANGLSENSHDTAAPPGPPPACKLSSCEKLRKDGPGCALGLSASLTINGSEGPLTVTRGTPLTIEWSSTNAASCSAFWQPGAPTVDPSGTDSQSASMSMDYMINCGGALASVTVTIVNAPPNAPAITHPTGSADFNILTIFSIQGSDPDGDNVFYEVDWNPNDSIDFDTNTPGGPSNSIQTASHAFSTAGRNTIRARTVDTSGATSGWTTYDININQAPAPVATLEAAVNGGSFGTGDQTVNPGDTVTIRWDSSNASSCAGSGSGFDTGGRTNGTDGVNTPAPNSQTTFTATCTGPGGEGGTSLTITVRQLPNLSKPNITYQLSTGFDLATGAYNYVDIFFNTSNNGGSDTRASADYRFEFDSGRNGYELTRTGSLGLFTVGQTVPRTERVQGPIIFGNSRVRVTVDSTDVVTETDETDNDRSVDLTFVPPDPGLSITADRQQLREGETTTVRWSSQATYPLDCRVSGPNVEVNPSGLTGTRQTAGIMAKSVFTFTCIEPITGTEFSTSVSVESAGTIEET